MNSISDNFKGCSEDNLSLEFTLCTINYNGFGQNLTAIWKRGYVKSNAGTRVNLGYYGRVKGTINGTFNGRDFANVRAHVTESNIHGIITTNHGEKIGVKILARTDLNGKFMGQVFLHQNSGENTWVNRQFFLAEGESRLSKMLLKVHQPQDSIPATNIFPDPDRSDVDYSNFPYTLEELQQHSTAISVYSGQGFVTNVETFGVDMDSVFSGHFPIPKEGLRMNSFFSGPTHGSLNGVMSGENYFRILPDGSLRMNSKIIVKTLEGEIVLLEALGASFPEKGNAWFETSRAVSNLEKYDDLTSRFNVGIGSTDRASGLIHYHHFGFEENPFAHQTLINNE